MEKKSKYLGMVLNGWWEVIDYKYETGKHGYFTLKNKANGNIIERVQGRTIKKIVEGKTQVSKLLCRRLQIKGKLSNAPWW